MRYLVYIFYLFLAFGIGYQIGVNSCCSVGHGEVYIDTIPYLKPVPKDSIILRYKTIKLPCKNKPMSTDTTKNSNDTVTIHDSVDVVIPISQKVFKTSDYSAYVSGYNTTLDSLFIYDHKVAFKNSSKWSLGLQAGYGFTNKGFSPYIGFGISYRLF